MATARLFSQTALLGSDWPETEPTTQRQAILNQLGGTGAKTVVSFMEPVDDLLALLEEDAGWRADHLAIYYSTVGLLPGNLAAVKRQIRRWQRDDLPALFLRAAKDASRGVVSAELAPHLERIRFVPERDGAEVQTLPALAAWSLSQAVQRGKFAVQACALCGLPWLATERGRYCRRPYRESPKGLSCRDFGKFKDFRSRQRSKGGTNG